MDQLDSIVASNAKVLAPYKLNEEKIRHSPTGEGGQASLMFTRQSLLQNLGG